MKLRNLMLTTGLLGMLLTNTVLALGLGEIKLNSSLNEPLDAEVQLTSIGELTDIEILVGLGSPRDFDNAGVERLFLLTDLSFAVDLTNRARPLLRITSRKPVREPYLNFLVEVQWPIGRLVREYTLLLDLPVYAQEREAAKKIEAASSGPQLSNSTAGSQSASNRLGSQPLSAGDGEYSVNTGDTVWAIAQRIRPEQASMNQTMAAIKQLNPDAFINDNINLLKKGAVLRLPEGSDIRALTEAAVQKELNQPEQIPAEDAAVAPVLDAGDSDAVIADSPATAGEGRLKLAALGVDDDSSAGGEELSESANSDMTVGSSGSGQDELIAAQEELDKSLRENDDLKTRIANLEEQLATMNRLVEIQDDSLRATQLAVQNEELEVSDETANSGADAPAQTASTDEGSDSDKSMGLAGWMDYLLYPLIALLALLLAVVMFFRNRKHDDDEHEELSLQTLASRQQPEPAEERLAEVFTESERQYVPEVAAELDESGLKDLEELELGDGEGVDPKGEADIYLSLGNYRQAENILRKAIESDPQNSSLWLKLLEVHVSANDTAAFERDRIALAKLNDSHADERALALESELLSGKTDEFDVVAEGQAGISAETSDSSADSADFENPTLDYDLGDVSANVSPVDMDYPKNDEEDTSSPEDRDLNEVDLFSSETASAEEDVTPASLTSPTATGDAHQDFDLDLDLDDMDIGALSTEIDESMLDIEFDEEDPALAEDGREAAENSADTATSDDQGFPLETTEVSIIESAEPQVEGDGFDSLASVEDSFGEDDESDTKLILAEAYVDMGDPENARELLEEVLQNGTEEQRAKANSILENMS